MKVLLLSWQADDERKILVAHLPKGKKDMLKSYSNLSKFTSLAHVTLREIIITYNDNIMCFI